MMLVLMLLQTAFYVYHITRISRIHDDRIGNEFSHIDEMSLIWIRSFLLCVTLIFVMMMASLFLIVHLNFIPDYDKITALVMAVSVIFLGYRGIISYRNPSMNFMKNGMNNVLPEKLESSNTLTASPELIQKIKSYMKENKPYLDPEITLTGLASEMGMGRNALSNAINSGLGMNFLKFINRYRVDEVVSLLENPENGNKNILRMGFDAGFNSKATFNHIFKKITGFTPKEYRLRLPRTNSDV